MNLTRRSLVGMVGDAWIATLPFGNVDGVPGEFSNKGRIRIGDTFFPVVGTVSTTHTMVDLGIKPSVKVGDIATVYDWREGSRPGEVGSVHYPMRLNPLLRRELIG